MVGYSTNYYVEDVFKGDGASQRLRHLSTAAYEEAPPVIHLHLINLRNYKINNYHFQSPLSSNGFNKVVRLTNILVSFHDQHNSHGLKIGFESHGCSQHRCRLQKRFINVFNWLQYLDIMIRGNFFKSPDNSDAVIMAQ